MNQLRSTIANSPLEIPLRIPNSASLASPKLKEKAQRNENHVSRPQEKEIITGIVRVTTSNCLESKGEIQFARKLITWQVSHLKTNKYQKKNTVNSELKWEAIQSLKMIT